MSVEVMTPMTKAKDSVADRLIDCRRQLEREMAPDPWTDLRTPVVSLLSEVCQALGLTAEDRFRVLGRDGVQALATISEDRDYLSRHVSANHRQMAVLRHVWAYGRIDARTYRQLRPHWHPETLRLDLADLVRRGLLAKNGATKGTYYTEGARHSDLVGMEAM